MGTNLASTLAGWRAKTVSADPPWQYKGYAGVGIPARVQHYRTMSLEELAAMPVRMVTEKDSILAMWVISSHLDQAIELGRAWGFTYRSILFIWDKGRMSFGKWSRQEAEICLLFTRGSPSRKAGGGGVRQIIREKPGIHSKKPLEHLNRLERLHGPGYLELFSRSTKPGWVGWGNESDLFALQAAQAVV